MDSLGFSGLEVLKRTAPESYLKGDFWLFRTGGKRGESVVPFPKCRFCHHVLQPSRLSLLILPQLIACFTSVAAFAAHSLKATFLSELAHAHADPQVLMS